MNAKTIKAEQLPVIVPFLFRERERGRDGRGIKTSFTRAASVAAQKIDMHHT